MNEIIAYCGLTCHNCQIYLATREKDQEKRKKMRVEIARMIKKQYGTEYKPDDISDCDGCKTEGGRLFSGSKDCHIRKCAGEKGIENCAHCSEYPCGELEKVFAKEPEIKKRLEELRSKL